MGLTCALDRQMEVIAVVTILVAAMMIGGGASDTKTPPKILVFGGNGFIGASTVKRLIQRGADVAIVNRGNWYWDSYNRIRPHVLPIVCDRKTSLVKCRDLATFIRNVNLDAVVDFSAYNPYEVREAVAVLRGKVRLYIYISTDSVYEVCEKNHAGPSRETDASRPETKEEQDKLNSQDDYGHRKLQGEEVLMLQRQDGGFPFVALRLPDVIGPRDSTYRWWIYQLWVKVSQYINKPVTIPQSLRNQPISFVYVDDVAEAVVRVINAGAKVYDQAINIAYPDVITLPQLLNDIKTVLGVKNVTFENENTERPMFFYPSVKKGPIDVSKALDLLGWQPTPWEEVVKTTVDFYEAAITDRKYSRQTDEIISIVNSHVADDSVVLQDALARVYKSNVEHQTSHRDEL